MRNTFSIALILKGAVLAVFMRFVLNNMWTINGVGWIDRWLGFPFSTWWMWAVGGTAYGAYRAVVRRSAKLDLATWASRHEDSYRESLDREDIGDLSEFGLFKDWHKGRHGVTIELAEEQCVMFDYTSISKGESTEYHSHTVILCPRLSEPLPKFELRSRGYFTGMMRLFGLAEIQIKGRDELTRTDAEALTRFNRQYLLFPESFEMQGQVVRGERLSGDENREPLHTLFSLELIRFFVDHDGWCIESTGNGLVIWRWLRVIPGSERDEMLHEVEQILSTLRKAVATPASHGIEFAECKTDGKSASRSYLRLSLCVFGGFIIGGLAGILGLANAEHLNVRGVGMLALFFGPMMLGLTIGVMLAWWFSRPR